MSPQGAVLTIASTGGLLGLVMFARIIIPPAPLAMPETSIGHGTVGSYECLPPSKHSIRADKLDGLRCGSLLREPGGVKEGITHVWKLRGHEIHQETPVELQCDDGDAVVFRSYLPPEKLPANPVGTWSCITYTVGGQLVGLRKFEVRAADANAKPQTGSGSAGSGSN
jgi:hypothetical protein